jgi:hypothetical protein
VEENPMRVKLSDEDLIFLGAAAIMGPMLQATHSWDKEELYKASAVSAALLRACKDCPQRSRNEASREEGKEALNQE